MYLHVMQSKFSEHQPSYFSNGGEGGRGARFTGSGDPPFITTPLSPQNYNHTIFKFSENEYLTNSHEF